MTLRNTEVVKGSQGSRRLVVLLHGWWASMPLFSIRDAREAILEELPDADLLEPTYTSHIAANTDPVQVAEALTDAIEEACLDIERTGSPYEEIMLVGYSLGSLIVRKTFVLGMLGRVADDSGLGVQQKYRWPAKVTRIVLLAGINNGWSLSPKPKKFSWLLYVMYRLLYPWAFILPAGRLIRSFHKGAPFVENLRIQWHFLEREHAIAPVIQLTGKEEDVVTIDDMVDIRFCRQFIFLYVPSSGHYNAANFQQRKYGAHRRERFVHALTRPIDELRREAGFDAPGDLELQVDKDASITDVVFLIHGIRDYGDWTHKVEEGINKVAKANGQRVVVYRPAYERFPLLGFLLYRERMKNVRWFIDQYTQVIAEYPQARIHFIGHSNGTYLLAKSLELYPDCRFHNVIFTGSVVRRSFPWDRIARQKRIVRLRNDMAADDLVVAVFPRFFEQISEATSWQFNDIGSGGVYGFQDNSGKRFEVRLRGGHGAALHSANHESLARFVLNLDEQPQFPAGLVKVERVPFRTRCASSLCWLVWISLFLLPLLSIWGMTFCWYKFAPSFFAVASEHYGNWLLQMPAPFVPLMGSILFTLTGIWWLLRTV